MIDTCRLEHSAKIMVVGLPSAADGVANALQTAFPAETDQSAWAEVLNRIDAASATMRRPVRHG